MSYKLIISGNYFQFKQSYINTKSGSNTKAQKKREHNKYLKETYNLDVERSDDPNQDYKKRKDNLSRSRNNFKLLAHANANKYSKLITLTTQEQLTLKEFQHAVHSFMKHLKREIKEPLKYIGVYELQERGAPHIHIIFFNEHFIEWSKALTSWRNIIGGLGSVQIKQLVPNKHINYLISYLKVSASGSYASKSIVRSLNLEAPKVYKDNIPNHLKNHFLKVEYSKIMGDRSVGNTFEHIYGYLSKETQEFTLDDAMDFLRVSIIRINRFNKDKTLAVDEIHK
jgi:hypothetical protein